jgi:hypothetical protein
MRSVVRFTINEKPLELRPAPRGYQIFIDGRVRYGGISFTYSEALDHVSNLARTEDVKLQSRRVGILKQFGTKDAQQISEKTTKNFSGPNPNIVRK